MVDELARNLTKAARELNQDVFVLFRSRITGSRCFAGDPAFLGQFLSGLIRRHPGDVNLSTDHHYARELPPVYEARLNRDTLDGRVAALSSSQSYATTRIRSRDKGQDDDNNDNSSSVSFHSTSPIEVKVEQGASSPDPLPYPSRSRPGLVSSPPDPDDDNNHKNNNNHNYNNHNHNNNRNNNDDYDINSWLSSSASPSGRRMGSVSCHPQLPTQNPSSLVPFPGHNRSFLRILSSDDNINNNDYADDFDGWLSKESLRYSASINSSSAGKGQRPLATVDRSRVTYPLPQRNENDRVGNGKRSLTAMNRSEVTYPVAQRDENDVRNGERPVSSSTNDSGRGSYDTAKMVPIVVEENDGDDNDGPPQRSSKPRHRCLVGIAARKRKRGPYPAAVESSKERDEDGSDKDDDDIEIISIKRAKKSVR